MKTDEISTLQNILDAGRIEFLEKGFRAASLRNIVKNAGVTTGAFYGYFSNKEALFAALVEKHAAEAMGKFVQTQDSFVALPKEEQPRHMGSTAGDYIHWLVDYAYDHFDAFKLILCCSEGTAYEDFVHSMVEIEVEGTYQFMDVMRELGNEVPEIDPQLMHMICSGMFNGMFESIIHGMSREQARQHVCKLKEFYQAGWSKLMGMDFG